MTSASDDRPKWALLIGIDRYPNVRPLSGCVNDVQVMRQVLTESFRFREDHVTVLTNEQATRDAILAAFDELVARVGNDDIVVVHFSGHGSQMTDVEGDAPDGRDETILPWDTGRAPLENRDIKDDEIYIWLRNLTAKTSLVTLIFDCCHSGDVTRETTGSEVRWVEPDLRPAELLPPSPIAADEQVRLVGSRDIGPSGWLPLGERYVLIAGCNSTERSFEIEEPEGVRHGALTYFLSQELLRVTPGTTYRDVFELAAPRVSSRFPNQHPQLEGARDLEVFGVRRIEPLAFVPVKERRGDLVILGAGAACGLREGSQWAVYKSGTKVTAPDEERLGVVSITSVRAVTSEGALSQESRPGAVAAGTRAVEESRALDTLLPVHVEAPSRNAADVQLLLERLDESRLLRRAARGKLAKARVYLLPPRSERDLKGRRVPVLGPLTEETWAVVGEGGELMMPAHRRNEPGVVQTLLDNLDKASRRRLVLDLRNGTSALAGKVDVELLLWTGARLETPERGTDGRDVFYEEDALAIRVANRSERPLFVYILDLGLTGQIHQVYPVSGSEKALDPGRTIEVGNRTGEEMNLYFPEEFPFAVTDTDRPEVEGFETLKIFATTHPTDFLPFFQSGFREGRIGPSGPAGSLADLLSVTFGGGGYRDCKPPSQAGAPEDWTTLERSFRLRRRAAAAQSVAGGRST